jgi:ribonuclease P protein component
VFFWESEVMGFNAGRLASYEISSIRKLGKRLATPEFIVFVNSQTPPLGRFAVIVPLAVDKRAVVRNRCKRLIQESLRLLTTQLPPMEMVVLIKKDISGHKQPDIQNKLHKLFQVNKILKKVQCLL